MAHISVTPKHSPRIQDSQRVASELVELFGAFVRAQGLDPRDIGDAQECMSDPRFTPHAQRWFGAFVALWDLTVGTVHDDDDWGDDPMGAWHGRNE